jgi:GT2 family glycosyltransferase
MRTRGVISFVLLNWNGRGFLRRCVESVMAQTSDAWELIAVDNGSSNDSLDYLRELARSGVVRRLIELPANRGYAVGMNVGISAASGRLIVPLNSDVYLARNFVESALGAAGSESAGMLASPVYRWRWSDVRDELTDMLYTVGVSLVRRLSVSAWHPDLDRAGALFAPEGSAPIFTRSALERAQQLSGHIFDERYISYGEDIDLFMRLNSLGYRCAPVLDTAIWHIGSASHQGMTSFEAKPLHVQSMVVRNRLRNFGRMPGWSKLVTTLPWVIADDVSRVLTLARRDLSRAIMHNYRASLRDPVDPYPAFPIPFGGSIHSRSGHIVRRSGQLPPLGHPHPRRAILLGSAA